MKFYKILEWRDFGGRGIVGLAAPAFDPVL
jgi:hypothetical protein